MVRENHHHGLKYLPPRINQPACMRKEPRVPPCVQEPRVLIAEVLSGFRSRQPTPSGCFGKCRLGGRVTPPGRCVHLTAYNTSRKILDARTEQSSAEASGLVPNTPGQSGGGERLSSA